MIYDVLKLAKLKRTTRAGINREGIQGNFLEYKSVLYYVKVYGLHSCKVQLKFTLTYINFTKKKKLVSGG